MHISRFFVFVNRLARQRKMTVHVLKKASVNC